jgi:hypothetical protein
MKSRIIVSSIVVALLISAAGFLRADDAQLPQSPPTLPAQTPSDGANLADANARIWYWVQYSSQAKDPESMGIIAVYEAADLVKDQTPDAQADFFKKVLYDAHSRGVQRAVRMKLAQIYKETGRNDLALEQLQALMTEQPQ